MTALGMPLPIITCRAMGGLGNVMGEYATLFAISRIYNTTAILSDSMKAKLDKIFPAISIPYFRCKYSFNSASK